MRRRLPIGPMSDPGWRCWTWRPGTATSRLPQRSGARASPKQPPWGSNGRRPTPRSFRLPTTASMSWRRCLHPDQSAWQPNSFQSRGRTAWWRWLTMGEPQELRRRFEGLASSIELETGTVTFAFVSPEEGQAFWERTSPPLMALKSMLPADRYQQVRSEAASLMLKLNQTRDGRLVLDSPYLSVRARVSRRP